MNDRFLGQPMSADACVTLGDDIICTGSDAIIRAVSVLPNRFVDVVGEHNELPIEQLRLSPRQNILASCSHDRKIKYWDLLSRFKQLSGKEVRSNATAVPKKSNMGGNFFEDL